MYHEHIYITFIYLADALIQSNLQMRLTSVITNEIYSLNEVR